MKRFFFYFLVILFLVVFFWISLDKSVSNNVMKMLVSTSENTMAPNNSTFGEILKPKPHNLPSIHPVLGNLQNRRPNLPVLSWLRMKNMDREDSADDSRCSIYPDILNIEYSNKYWQIFRSENATFYLYSAILGIKKTTIIPMSSNNVLI